MRTGAFGKGLYFTAGVCYLQGVRDRLDLAAPLSRVKVRVFPVVAPNFGAG